MPAKRVWLTGFTTVILMMLALVSAAPATGAMRLPARTGAPEAPVEALAEAAGAPLGSTFPIRVETEVEVNPSIAYNSQRQEYLVVLWNDRPGNDDIRAERVASDGRLLGGVWVAAGDGTDRRRPDVTYNSVRNEYLVVWEEQSGGVSYIRARRLSGEAQLLGGVIDIIAGPLGSLTSSNPAVAYASTPDKYLVVWEYEILVMPNLYISVVGQIVNGDGTLAPSSINISVDSGGTPREQPDVAYNRHANGFLVVWQQWVPGTPAGIWDVYGRLVNGTDGAMPTAEVLINPYVQSGFSPAVGAIPTAPGQHKFLVAWEVEYAPGDRHIVARPIEENGTPGPTTLVAITAADESAPAVAGTENGHTYLVVWRNRLGVVDVPIHARAISSDGYLLGQEREFSGVAADTPAVASGPVGDFLVAWQDKPNSFATHTDIYGRLWGERVYLPLSLRNY